MDGSCIDESTTSTESVPPCVKKQRPGKSPERLYRMGSGMSVVLDLENGVEAESRNKLPSSKYKGVVPQPNGRWGAQIYEKHQRVWLGTFNGEDEAAIAYDVAVRRFRGRDAVTNFKKVSGGERENEQNDAESAFLNAHSKAEIVDMLRKHTYEDELEQSKRKYLLIDGNGNLNGVSGGTQNASDYGVSAVAFGTREVLFEKAVTPSDVGKLNRLVIPKQHAEKHFPVGAGNSSVSTKGVLLNLEDATGKVWRFRYSYWNSSQSYVLTKGWSRFVKEKNLRAGDVVCFQRSTGPDKQLYIDWKIRSDGTEPKPVQVVRLFGVDIFQPPASGNDGLGGCGRKRTRAMDLFGLDRGKKQKMIEAL